MPGISDDRNPPDGLKEPRRVNRHPLRKTQPGGQTNVNHYIGFDIHKKTISYCVKLNDGKILEEGVIAATRRKLEDWAVELREPWVGAMEATMFTGWVYDTLKPWAIELKVAHPPMLKAIAASKKKNDRVDARKIADLLRCDLLPECYIAPTEVRELRRMLRYRNLVVTEAGADEEPDCGTADGNRY